MFTDIIRQNQRPFLLIAALFLWLAAPAHAQDALLTSDVSMDVTGLDATDAKTQALKKAEREGLDQLLERLQPTQKAAILARLDDAIISAMVKGVEVLDEKIAGPRYRAQLRVSYNALAVDTLLDKKVGAEGAPAPEANITSTSILVIPVYEEDGTTVLWEPTNPWRDAWKRTAMGWSGGDILVPYGDAADMEAITTEAVQTANLQALMHFFTRYGVGEVVVMKTVFRKGENSGLDVVHRHIGKNRSDVYVQDYRGDPQEELSSLMGRASQDLIEQISRQRQDLLAKQAAAAREEDGRLTLLVPLNTLDSWTKVRTTLLKLPSVTKLDITAISPQQVDVLLRFRGPQTSLANDITGVGLRVVQENGYWIVSKD